MLCYNCLCNFFSKRWVQKNVLRQPDEEIETMSKEIEDEGGGEEDDNMMMSNDPTISEDKK